MRASRNGDEPSEGVSPTGGLPEPGIPANGKPASDRGDGCPAPRGKARDLELRRGMYAGLPLDEGGACSQRQGAVFRDGDEPLQGSPGHGFYRAQGLRGLSRPGPDVFCPGHPCGEEGSGVPGKGIQGEPSGTARSRGRGVCRDDLEVHPVAQAQKQIVGSQAGMLPPGLGGNYQSFRDEGGSRFESGCRNGDMIQNAAHDEYLLLEIKGQALFSLFTGSGERHRCSLGRRRRLSSLTTAPETDIPVGFSALALSPRGYSLRPWGVEFTLCPATLPLP